MRHILKLHRILIVAVAMLAAAILPAAASADEELGFDPSSHCSWAQKNAIESSSSRITVTGADQYGKSVTWTLTNRDREWPFFITGQWWWHGAVDVRVRAANGWTFDITAWMPYNNNGQPYSVLLGAIKVGCWGTVGSPRTVQVPDMSVGYAPACISPSDPVGQYTLTKQYWGSFYYDGHYSTNGTPLLKLGTFSTVRNMWHEAYAVPTSTASGSYEVCAGQRN